MCLCRVFRCLGILRCFGWGPTAGRLPTRHHIILFQHENPNYDYLPLSFGVDPCTAVVLSGPFPAELVARGVYKRYLISLSVPLSAPISSAVRCPRGCRRVTFFLRFAASRQLIELYGEDARLFLLQCLVEETGFKEQRAHTHHGNKDAQKVQC